MWLWDEEYVQFKRLQGRGVKCQNYNLLVSLGFYVSKRNKQLLFPFVSRRDQRGWSLGQG